MDRERHVVRLEDVPKAEFSRGERYALAARQLARAAGGRQLGCTWYEVPPGRRPVPYHAHGANEEAIYVLEGEGTLRLGGKEIPIRAGHYVACLVGEEGAHQVVNTSDAPLSYLCFSTMREPEVATYPDSGRVAVFAGSPPGGDPENVHLLSFFRRDDAVDYHDGER